MNLVFDLRTSSSGTLESSVPYRGIEPRLAASSLPCYPVHLQGKCLDQESNLDLDLRRVLCDPLHHRDIQRPDLESNQGQGLRRALCDPLHHRDDYPRGRRLDLHQHRPVYRTGALLVRPRRLFEFQAGARGFRTPSDGFGGHLLSQEHTPVSAPGLATRGIWRNDYSCSVTFQYASLTNFDQLAIRMLWSAYSGFQAGRTGCLRSRIRACSGVRSAFRLLQATQASTQFCQLDTPPCERGTTWSSVSSSPPGWRPQYWQVLVVPLENVPAAEGDGTHRQPVVAGQRDHLRHPQPEPHRLDERLVRRGFSLDQSAQV